MASGSWMCCPPMLTIWRQKLSSPVFFLLVTRKASKRNNHSFSNHLGKCLLKKLIFSFSTFNVSQCTKWLRPVNNILLTKLARKWADWIFSVLSFSGTSVLKTQPTLSLYTFLHPTDAPMDIPQPNSSRDPQGHSPFPLLTNVFSSSPCWQGPSGPISECLPPSLHMQHLTDTDLDGFSPISSVRLFLIPLATSVHCKRKQKRLC